MDPRQRSCFCLGSKTQHHWFLNLPPDHMSLSEMEVGLIRGDLLLVAESLMLLDHLGPWRLNGGKRKLKKMVVMGNH